MIYIRRILKENSSRIIFYILCLSLTFAVGTLTGRKYAEDQNQTNRRVDCAIQTASINTSQVHRKIAEVAPQPEILTGDEVTNALRQINSQQKELLNLYRKTLNKKYEKSCILW